MQKLPILQSNKSLFLGEKKDAFEPNMAYGRGRGQVSALPGLGRGMAPTVGAQATAPPPGFQPAFVVPNVNLIKNGVTGECWFMSGLCCYGLGYGMMAGQIWAYFMVPSPGFQPAFVVPNVNLKWQVSDD